VRQGEAVENPLLSRSRALEDPLPPPPADVAKPFDPSSRYELTGLGMRLNGAAAEASDMAVLEAAYLPLKARAQLGSLTELWGMTHEVVWTLRPRAATPSGAAVPSVVSAPRVCVCAPR
jgi:hypothetical protein